MFSCNKRILLNLQTNSPICFADPWYKPSIVLSLATTTINRIDTSRRICRSARVCSWGNGAKRGRESRVFTRVGTNNGFDGFRRHATISRQWPSTPRTTSKDRIGTQRCHLDQPKSRERSKTTNFTSNAGMEPESTGWTKNKLPSNR